MFKKTPVQYALDLIKLRDRSEFEVRKKMKEKEFTTEEIETTVKFLFDKKFLDDERFAEIYIKNERSIGRNGATKIRFKLKNFGINDEVISKYLKNESASSTDLENAKTAVRKWLKINSNTPKEKTREKLFRHLAGRGFEYEIIKEVINSHLAT